MGRDKYAGVREASDSTIEIDFYYQGKRCRERINLKPTPTNLKKASLHRAAVLSAIEAGTFDYAFTFPNSKNATKFSSSKYTVKSYLTEWLENKKPVIKASTYSGYRRIINHFLIPAFGSKLLESLGRSDVRMWAANTTCSNKSITNVLSPLRAALHDALNDGLIQVNPLSGWHYRRNEAPEKTYQVDPFTAEEQKKIIDHANGQIKNQCIVFFWTGMRTSELIALEWDDIDWNRKKIKIDKAFTYASEVDERTKTKTGTREIDMLPPVEQALINQKQYTLLHSKKIFLNPKTGERYTGDQQVRKSFWIPLLEKAGVRYRNPYQTRHTFASMMLSAGESISWVSQQMGHSNVLITARTYARWIPSVNQQGNKALGMFGEYLIFKGE